jgi:hypothetical protein
VELAWTVVSMKDDRSTVYGKADRPMSDLTAVDILIQPDAGPSKSAREVNRRMPLSIPAGITLDDTHLPHITMLQRYPITANLDHASAAIAAVREAVARA